MDCPDAKRFLGWFFALAYYHLLTAIFSLLCIIFFATLHWFSQSRFISGASNCTCRSGLMIFILDEDSQGKGIGPCWWFATQTLASEWKAWSMSLWELTRTSSNKLNSKLVSELEKGWCDCDLRLHWQVSYRTMQLERCKRKRRAVKDAADAEVEV